MLEVYNGDLAMKDGWDALTLGITHVFHCASPMYDVN